MKRKALGGQADVEAAERIGASSPTPAMVTATAAAHAAVLDLAEEFGKLLARRELSLRARRRGYSLPELLLGAAVTAFTWLLVARVLGLLPH